VRSNRAAEYDSLSADYVTFVEKEILAEVSKKYTLTDDPNLRAICGMSSGGLWILQAPYLSFPAMVVSSFR